MEELNLKQKELNQELGATKSIIEDIKRDIEKFKANKENYSGAEIALGEFKEKERQLEKKISIVNAALEILLGI